MTCKNCESQLSKTTLFCSKCGAKIIDDRITVKNLLSDAFVNAFGWDNKFYVTIKTLILKPKKIFEEYINGTRKRYMNPFAFLTIGLAIVVFVFNTFSDNFMNITKEANESQIEWYVENFGESFANEEFQQKMRETSDKSTGFMLKYLNIFSYLNIPIYALLAFIVYRKPFNYGEHLVINSYIQGLGFLSATFLFLLSILIHPLFYYINIPIIVFYYSYSYGRLYKLSFWNSVLKLIIFLSLLIAIIVGLMIIGVIIGFLFSYLTH